LEDLLDPLLIEALVEGKSQLTMIDLGCGSGILGIAAVKLGVSHALGVDLDPEAVEAARQNSVVNDVGNRLDFFVGSLAEIKSGSFPIKRAPLVVANILAPVLVRLLAGGLNDIVATHGKLILSGILEQQTVDVETAVQASGMHLKDKRQDGDWLALLVDQPG
jgi:ribosomal protein L11 methyltransferase